MYLATRSHVIQMNPNAQHRDILILLLERWYRSGITWPFKKVQAKKGTDITDTQLNLLCQFKITQTLIISAGTLALTVTDMPKPYVALVTVKTATEKVSVHCIIMREICINLMCKWRLFVTSVAVSHQYGLSLQSAPLFFDLSPQQNPQSIDGMCK